MATTHKTVRQARRFRRTMSPPEIALWQILRERPADLKFRRQHPLGPYVLDFYCPAANLAVEVDGLAHDSGDRPERDARRDAWLVEQGVETMRISAQDVLRDVWTVADGIVQYCRGKC
ncbi:MAG: endonuclease domain-containing protein [Pseudomonadota bacterium]